MALARSCGLPAERLSDELRITVPDRGLAWAWIKIEAGSRPPISVQLNLAPMTIFARRYAGMASE